MSKTSQFFAKNWADMLITIVVIGGMFHFNDSIGSIDGKMIELSTNQRHMSERIGRIAEELPGIGARMAWETIYSRFETAVFVTKPYAVGGNWKTNIHVIAAGEKTMKTYVKLLPSQNAKDFMFALVGSVILSDDLAVSVKKMEALGMEIKKPTVVPDFIDKEASYIMRRGGATFEAHLDTLGARMIATSATPAVPDWPTLVKEMKGGRLVELLASGS